MYPKYLKDIGDTGVRYRVATERKIVMALIDHALAEGYELAIDDGDVRPFWTTDRRTLIDNIMETDEDYLRFRKDGKIAGWVFLVYGNEGWDVICDNTTNLEEFLAPITKLAEGLEPTQ